MPLGGTRAIVVRNRSVGSPGKWRAPDVFNVLAARQGVAKGKPGITEPLVLLGQTLRNSVLVTVRFPNIDFGVHCCFTYKKKNTASAAAGVELVRAALFFFFC